MTLPPVVLPPIAPRLVAEGLILRPWEPADATFVLELAADPETRRWAPTFRPITTHGDALAFIVARLERRTMWVITDGAGQCAGWIGLSYLEPDERSMMIAYGSAPGWRRRGVVRRAVTAVCDWAFAPEGLGLIRISLEHATTNAGSCAVAAACGFAVEGTLRQRILRDGGGLDDSHAHARLVSDPAERLTAPAAPAAPIEPVEIVAGAFQLCLPNPDLDAATIFAACADPAIRLFNVGPADVAAARTWCINRADWSAGTHASWVVKDTIGTLLGQVSLFAIDTDQRVAQIGYWVAAEARGRGVASAAVAAAAAFGLSGLGLHRIELFHAVENAASCRTAEKAGFAFEGIQRLSYRYGDGQYRDEHRHSRLASTQGMD